jgi:integrase
MGRGINRLTALAVQKLTKPGNHADGGGLYLCVRPTGGKFWIFKYRFGGREREMGLGSLITFTLAESRDRALAQRKLLADGIDPLEQKQTRLLKRKLADASVITFDTAAARYIDAHKGGWRNDKHVAQWTSTLATYARPVFGTVPVGEVSTALVLRVLTPIWAEKTETASRVRGRIEKILDWAKSQGYRAGDNPAAWRGHLENLLSAPKKTQTVEHHPALPYREIGAFMRDVRNMPGTGALVLQFIIQTACRTSEAIEARWAEIDFDNALWSIPSQRMKSGKEHVIPLTPAAIDLLKAAQKLGQGDYVFPGGKVGKPLSNMACLVLLKRMERGDLTVHGFRSTFRDWAGETTAHPREVIEHALAHQLRDKAEAAYQRGTLLQKRRLLMADWSAYCGKISG